MAPVLLELKPPRSSRRETAALMADYLAFDRQRRGRQPFIKAFTGFAIVMLGGGVVGTVPWGEAELSAAVLALACVRLMTLNSRGLTRLKNRLAALRARQRRAGL
jgi:hypothetical protein